MTVCSSGLPRFTFFAVRKLFRDDTQRLIKALWPNSEPPQGSTVLELGCGPGLYARQLAQRFRQISVLGIDSSKQLVKYAREKAKDKRLSNCSFEWGNVFKLSQADHSFTELVASRLFTILRKREQAVAEIFRVLLSGGRCFIDEPRFAFSAAIPLLTMRALARANGYSRNCRDPMKARVLRYSDFRALFATQPWLRMKTWRVGRYQYALCEKG